MGRPYRAAASRRKKLGLGIGFLFSNTMTGFDQVGWKSIVLNAPNMGQFLKNNASGMVIFANEQMIGQAGSRAVKAATEKDKSSKK